MTSIEKIADTEARRNVHLTISYDGTSFHGWQVQPMQRTVQGTLLDALSRICGDGVELFGTSRTDAGVHAYRQHASLRGEFMIPAHRIPSATNGTLHQEGISIVDAEDMPVAFHARFSAKGKTYLYRIRDGASPDIFLRNYRYQLDQTLDIAAMRQAAGYLLGTHDFSAFGASGSSSEQDPVKTLESIRIDAERSAAAREIELRIRGDSFLYNMVRIIVGTLVLVGLGKMSEDELRQALVDRSRAKAGPTAPPGGLWLEEVHYENI